MISQDTIDNIISSANIKEVIEDFITLKKAGVNFKACCPFHDEKTPSFVVSPAKNIYKCFGCGAAGGPINFIMEYKKYTYPEALKYLAKKYGIEIKEKEQSNNNKKLIDKKNNLFKINKLALKYFSESKKSKNAEKYINQRFTKEEIIQWKIGFAPDDWQGLLNFFTQNKILQEYYLLSNLIKISKNKLYDYYRNRIIFPIFNYSEQIFGFAGRIIIPDKNTAKYLNPPQNIIYDKSNILYGLNYAFRAISKQNNCNIVEGYTDVIRLHSCNIENTVAPCGTSLTIQQLNIIKRYTNNITLIYDGDSAGQNAYKKNAKIAIKNNFNVHVVILPEKEDPYSFFKTENESKKYIKDNRTDYLLYISNDLFTSAGDDPLLKYNAINNISTLLSNYDINKRNLYLEQICKINKINSKLFKDKLNEIDNINNDDEKEILPKEINAKEFNKWGFYEYKNEYYFRTKFGIEKLSNFIMKPIFHNKSIYDSKRIYELINKHGYKVVVNFDMQEMTSLQAFQKNVEGKGNFLFWGQSGQFSKLKLKLYEETRTCEEILNLGWQKEGFWAWANGIINDDGNFVPIDEFGIVKYHDVNYFIPAYSKIYIQDKTLFLDERKFKYKKSDLSLKDWMDLFLKVHGDNAMISFAWYLSALFRDHIIYLNDNFPILNLFGQKNSGKNSLAYSLLSLFGKKQNEFNIHNGTKPGLSKHLEIFRNAIAFIDEYKNSLDFDKIETLKSIYNSIGRSRMNMNKGGKKETTEVNQSVILAGQEMPTVDVALSTRTIFLQFLTKVGLSKKQKENFDKLLEIERDGLSHISAMFLKHRKYFVKHYKENYDKVMIQLCDETAKEEINDRLIRNICTILASFKCLENKFDFNFSYEKLFKYSLKVTREHNTQIKQSDEIGIFWNLLEAMFDDNILIDKWHFNVKMLTALKTTKNEKQFPDGKRVLRFKFNSVAKLYAEQLRRRNEKPLPQDSLKHYLSTNKFFLGIEKACKFVRKDFDPGEGKVIEQKQTTTAFCFDYDKLNINLIREAINDNSNDTNNPNQFIESDKDDLPF